MTSESSPTARAIQTLELLQDVPGITADRLARRLGVSERAARRYVAILREAGVPVVSTRGPYGGYRVGRGLRPPPLLFTSSEALGLVMAVLEGPHGAAGPDDPVGSALGKFIRVLPESLAAPAEAVRALSARRPDPSYLPDPATVAALVGAGQARRQVVLDYRRGPGGARSMRVDPWAVVVRHGRWYLLGWSHHSDARRVLRVDRVAAVEVLDESFVPPDDLDPMQALEEHLSQGWSLQVEVTVDAPVTDVERWLPRSLGRLEAVDDGRTRLVASTDEPEWYAAQLTALRAPFRVVSPPELRDAVGALGRRLVEAVVGS